ncbi:hypothetical protein GBF38_017784, partial [Nibea albiflora]
VVFSPKGKRDTSGITARGEGDRGLVNMWLKLCLFIQTAPRAGFRIPGQRPSELDKKMLVWSGRFKTVDQIPELVSFEMIDAARNKVRVKACYVMIAITVGSCLVMVILGKRAAGRHESLTGQNMERKARWREEGQREREAALALSEKGH